MATGNRVEELESRVRKLEATVEGLTDELIETKERLREVEDAAYDGSWDGGDDEADDETEEGPILAPEFTTPDDVEAAEDDKGPRHDGDDNDGVESGPDDIIVA